MLVVDRVRHREQHRRVGRHQLGEAAGGVARHAGVDAGADRPRGEAPAQAVVAGRAGRAHRGDAPGRAREPGVEHHPLADLEPRRPRGRAPPPRPRPRARAPGGTSRSPLMALSLSPLEVEQDLLGVRAADAGEPGAGHEPVGAERPGVGQVAQRAGGDGEVADQAVASSGAGRWCPRLGLGAEHEGPHRRPRSERQLAGEAPPGAPAEQRRHQVADRHRRPERRPGRSARAGRPRPPGSTARHRRGGDRPGPGPVVGVAAGGAEVGGHRPGVHQRHADAVGLELDRQRLGQPHDGELGGGVDRLERRADAAGDRPDRDQVPAAALDHPGHHGPQGVDRAEHVDPDQPLGLVGPRSANAP